MTVYPFLSAIVIMLSSLSGVLFVSRRFAPWMERNLPYLVTFSIGVFLVIVWGLFSEAFEHAAISVVLLSALGGIVFIKLSTLVFPEAHHHHEASTDHAHTRTDARHLLLGDAVHNVTDGFLLVPAFLADFRVGLATAAGIFLHELVQEISEFFVLRQAGYTAKGAILRNFLASSTILVGVALSLFLSSVESLESPLVAFSAGAFLYVIVRDLLPSSAEAAKKKRDATRHAGALALGLLIMIAVSAVVPHAPEEKSETRSSEVASLGRSAVRTL